MWILPMLLNRIRPYALSLILAIVFAFAWVPKPALAAIETYSFASDNEAVRFNELTQELRCPKCQNQSLADSDSIIATDLRSKVKTMLDQGQSDEDIRAFMVQRYGDFILYDPPFKAATLVLWLAPVLLVLLGGAFLWRLQRRKLNVAKHLSVSEQQHLQAMLDATNNQSTAKEPPSD